MIAGALGRYRITGPLGAGAMGEVYLARDESLGRDVAVKAMRPLPGYGDALSERFFNEAKAVAALAHPNVIQVFDLGEDGGVPFMVMEVAAGGSLRSRLERGPRLDHDAIRALGIQMAHALAAAHERGILHRDVKPANILEARPGLWKLADFGVAHVPDARLTMTGQFLGSPAYAAPESLELGEFSPASDVYGLAATMFEVVTGRSPHLDRTHETRILQGDLDTAAHAATIDPAVPASIRETILRGLARAPERRPTAEDVAAMFATIESVPAPVPVHPPVLAASPPPRDIWSRWPVRLGSLALAAAAVAMVTMTFLTARGAPDEPPATPAKPREGAGSAAAPAAAAAAAAARAPAAAAPASPAAPKVPRGDPDDHGRRWVRVREALAAKRWHTADARLVALIERYPDDDQARALLDRLRAELAEYWRRKLATQDPETARE